MTTNTLETIYLLPEQITVDERFNVRPWSSEAEDDKIEKLADSISKDGQLDPVIVAQEEDGRYTLIAGHRRRQAVERLNLGRDGNKIPLRVTVDKTGGDYFRKAIVSNLQRKDFSPMDLALLIQKIRQEHGWFGASGTSKVAEYLGVNRATVSQHEKFLGAPKDLQDKLHRGIISAQSGQDILSVAPHLRGEILERAADIQARADLSEDDQERLQVAEENNMELPLPEPARIERPSIVKAIRDTDGATEVPIPLTRKEILAFFEQFDSDVYGYPDGSIRKFVRYLVDRLQVGKGDEGTAKRLFDQMVKAADRGTKPDDSAHATRRRRLPRKDKVLAAGAE
jgi:ParB/RepB/Spo0J family partition protein